MNKGKINKINRVSSDRQGSCLSTASYPFAQTSTYNKMYASSSEKANILLHFCLCTVFFRNISDHCSPQLLIGFLRILCKTKYNLSHSKLLRLFVYHAPPEEIVKAATFMATSRKKKFWLQDWTNPNPAPRNNSPEVIGLIHGFGCLVAS